MATGITEEQRLAIFTTTIDSIAVVTNIGSTMNLAVRLGHAKPSRKWAYNATLKLTYGISFCKLGRF